jgi:hypothetical protein
VSAAGRAATKGRGVRLAALCAFVALMTSQSARAGPPFVTDDPEPVETGHWEVYGFSTGTHVQGDTSGDLAGVEVNFGAAPNLQLHLIAPLAFDAPAGGGLQTGLGDVELGVKYRLIDPGRGDWWPQVGVFPLIEAPTGDERRGLGDGRVRAFLPVWIQKDFGGWTTYGGGGYWINPGPGKQDYWFAGWLLQRQVTKKLALGGEVFHQTPDTVAGKAASGFNLGGVYDFTEHYHLLFSAGRGFENAARSNDFSYYLGAQWTF